MSSWEAELREHFPAYLLPASGLAALPRVAAERFLARLTGDPDALALLIVASVLAPVADGVRQFAHELRLAASVLPSRTEVERVESEGYVRGRVDVPGTLRTRLAEGPGRVVSRVRRRRFDSPENILLAVTATQLAGNIERLSARGILPKGEGKGWGRGLRLCAESIRHTMASTVLREVPQQPLTAFDERAARAASHPAYRLALLVHDAMARMDVLDAATTAKLVAEGALAPLDPATRFEIAVLIRLGRSIDNALSAHNCTMSRGLIEEGRDHVFEFALDRKRLRIRYNQVPTFGPPGPRERGMLHYFGARGRFRPDLIIEVFENEKRIRAVVVEIKHSEREGYLKDGFHEALLYRDEYNEHLTGWPKAILVVSADAIQGLPRRDDDVVATSWGNWVPETVLDGLLGEMR